MAGNTPLEDDGRLATIPDADAIWQKTLADLRLQMPAATFERLLLGSRALAWNRCTNAWTIDVRNQHSPVWLQRRLWKVVERAMDWRLRIEAPAIAGWPAPRIEYVAASRALRPPGTVPSNQAPLRASPPKKHHRGGGGHSQPPAPSRQRAPASRPDAGASGTAPCRAAEATGSGFPPAQSRATAAASAGQRPGSALQPIDYYVRLKIAFRTRALRLLKGTKLSVFVSVALNQDRDGVSAPGLERIVRETGCCRTAVIGALHELCSPELAFLEPLPAGRRGTNRYRVLGYVSFGRGLAPALLEEEGRASRVLPGAGK